MMKKKIWSMFSLLFALCFMIAGVVQAEEKELVDGSYLTMQESSSGSTNSPMLRGQYLMDGDSTITKAGNGKIYVYGQTTANRTVDCVEVVVFVEKYNEDTKSWGQIDAWVEKDYNTYYVATGKSMKVERGYYYRVTCDHFAGDDDDLPYDASYSFTDGIYIP